MRLDIAAALILGAVVCLAPGSPASAEQTNRLRLVVLGDSIAAGYGIDPAMAFPSRLQEKVDAAGLPFEIVNAGVSGDTTAGGLRRLNWLLRRPIDVLFIELGGNDGLRGIPPEATHSNLVAIISTVRSKQPGVTVVLGGMQMPPNLGSNYVRAFREVYPAVAELQKVALVPHVLEGVGGKAEMNLPDQIHPTAEGHAIIASNIWVVLKPVLQEVARSRGFEG